MWGDNKRLLKTIAVSGLLALSGCGGGGSGGGTQPPAPPPPPPPPPPPMGTFISGTVLDTNAFAADGTELPIVGVSVRFIGETDVVVTDANGEFVLENLQAGAKVIDFDTANAEPAPTGDAYAGFRERIEIADGANEITRPFYLPRIAANSLTTVDPNVDTVVTNADIGVSLTVFAGTARDGNGDLFTGQLSISEVPDAIAPAALPEDLEPGLLFTVQPVGVVFTTPATLSIRNDRDSWPAGSAIDFWSLDPELGVFAIVGAGEVAGDQSTIETLSGGVRAADWHAALPPALQEGDPPDDNDNDCQGGKCTFCPKVPRTQNPRVVVGSDVEVKNGRFREQIFLPAYFSQGKNRGLVFGYASDRAFPVELMAAAPTVAAATPVPITASYQGFLNGVDQGFNISLDSSVIEENQEEAFRIVLPLDGTQLPTGSYVGQARVSSHYTATSVSTRFFQDYMIVNDMESEFGAGWRLLNHERIYPAASGGVVLVDEGGYPMRFREANGSGSVVTILANGDARPEVDALQALLDSMGIAHQFRSTGSDLNITDTPISSDDIQDSALFIAVGTNSVGLFGFGGLNDDIKRNVIDVLESAHDQGVPLLFAGDDLGPFTSQLVESDLARFERLMGVRRNTAEEPRGGGFGTEGLWRLNVPDHPIFNGAFGTIEPDPNAAVADGLGAGSAYSPAIDQPAGLGETVLVTEYAGASGEILNDHAIFTHNNAISGAPALTITAEMPSIGASLPEDVSTILQNSIAWLTTNVAEPGELVSPPGDYSTLTLLEDGTYTRRTKYGDVSTFDSEGLLQTMADRNGNTTRFDYDASQLLTSMTDPVGKVTEFSYTDSRLASVVDPANRTTSFEYDPDGNLIQVTLPDGSIRQFAYDANHLMSSQTDQRGFTTQYVFNSAGQFMQSTQADGSVRSLIPAQSIGLVE